MPAGDFPIRGVADALKVLKGHGFAVEKAGNRWRVTLTGSKRAVEVRRGELLLMADAVKRGQGLDTWGNPQIRRLPKGAAHVMRVPKSTR